MAHSNTTAIRGGMMFRAKPRPLPVSGEELALRNAVEAGDMDEFFRLTTRLANTSAANNSDVRILRALHGLTVPADDDGRLLSRQVMHALSYVTGGLRASIDSTLFVSRLNIVAFVRLNAETARRFVYDRLTRDADTLLLDESRAFRVGDEALDLITTAARRLARQAMIEAMKRNRRSLLRAANLSYANPFSSADYEMMLDLIEHCDAALIADAQTELHDLIMTLQ
jgi:hypothetical protein